MATTRIISMHVSHGKTIADCLTDRIDYSKNPDKTQGGELISAYECDPKTADAEFLYSKRQYQTVTGREQRHDVIAYQVRQSFKPGEITPEDANRVGYEFAERFLKGRHAFFVATHTDKKHIHNHIIWNSTTLDCKHKFRDFLGSGRAVARLSDAICTEHRLSVITDPKRGVNHYGRWLGNKAKSSHRELLCGLIDAALLQKPDSFDTLLKLLAEAGCEVRRRGNTLSLRHPDRKGFVRLSSIDGYTEDELRAVLAGEKEHTPRKSGRRPRGKRMLYSSTLRRSCKRERAWATSAGQRCSTSSRWRRPTIISGSMGCWTTGSWRKKPLLQRNSSTRFPCRSRRRRRAWRRSPC